MKVFAVLAVFCFHDSKFSIVTPSLDNDTSCYLCQIKELLLSSLEVRIVDIVVKMQTHFATIAMSIFPEPKVHATCLYSLLPFCIHRTGLGYDICKRSRRVIDIDEKVADLCHTCLKFCPIINFCLMNLLRTSGYFHFGNCRQSSKSQIII